MNGPRHRTMHLIEKVIPGIRVARTYQWRWLRADLIAGITVFTMPVPQGMANGELAGVAPVVGLYSALTAMVGYTLFGSSRLLLTCPDTASSFLVAMERRRRSKRCLSERGASTMTV